MELRANSRVNPIHIDPAELVTLFLQEKVQTEGHSIQNEQSGANRGAFYSFIDGPVS
jgi:hypothetical protein